MHEPWQPVKQARNTWRGERAPGRRIEFRARPSETQGIPSGQHPLQRIYKESQFRNGISEMLEDLEVLESVSARFDAWLAGRRSCANPISKENPPDMDGQRPVRKIQSLLR
jgi:hypothetical protein